MWTVTHDTAALHDVLLAPPEHFRWLPLNSIARRAIAEAGQAPTAAQIAAQHGELRAALEQASARVHMLPGEPHLPYLVYTRDPAVVTPWGPVLGQCMRAERRGEYAPHLRFFEGRFWQLCNTGTLEGGDVHLVAPGFAAIGVSGGRTDEAGATQLAAWLRAEGWQVELVPFDEHFLHLDVIFAMVAPGLALACRDALDAGFLDTLAARGIRVLDVPYAEAMQLMSNVLPLGRGAVVSAREAMRVNAVLRAEGLTVLDPALSCFTMGGGGPRCLTCPLSRTDTP
jgi:arginine deiminase